MALLYGRAGRLTARNGGFRPGQWRYCSPGDVHRDEVYTFDEAGAALDGTLSHATTGINGFGDAGSFGSRPAWFDGAAVMAPVDISGGDLYRAEQAATHWPLPRAGGTVTAVGPDVAFLFGGFARCPRRPPEASTRPPRSPQRIGFCTGSG